MDSNGAFSPEDAPLEAEQRTTLVPRSQDVRVKTELGSHLEDDNDTGPINHQQIMYAGQWQFERTFGDALQGTRHGAMGDGASVAFDFTGK